jgi:hypothetical protein
MTKSRNKVAGTNYFIWVQKPKGGIVPGRNEFKAMETLLLETSSIRSIAPKPAHPEHLFRNRMLRGPLYTVNHINVKYSYDSSIFEWMIVVVPGQGHDICMVAWINCILALTNIVCSVVYPHDFVEKQTIVDNAYLPMFLC